MLDVHLQRNSTARFVRSGFSCCRCCRCAVALLLEHALRLLIQTKTDEEEKTQQQEDAAGGFAAGLLRFRKMADLNHFIDIDEFTSGLRDWSPGRDVAV